MEKLLDHGWITIHTDKIGMNFGLYYDRSSSWLELNITVLFLTLEIVLHKRSYKWDDD